MADYPGFASYMVLLYNVYSRVGHFLGFQYFISRQLHVNWVPITKNIFWLSENCVLTCGNIKNAKFQKNKFYEINFCKSFSTF